MSKVSKQDLKTKTDVVKQILKMKGETYDKWLLEKSNEFISNNVSFLINKIGENKAESNQVEEKEINNNLY